MLGTFLAGEISTYEKVRKGSVISVVEHWVIYNFGCHNHGSNLYRKKIEEVSQVFRREWHDSLCILNNNPGSETFLGWELEHSTCTGREPNGKCISSPERTATLLLFQPLTSSTHEHIPFKNVSFEISYLIDIHQILNIYQATPVQDVCLSVHLF